MIRLIVLFSVIPQLALALSGKLQGSVAPIVVDAFHSSGKILADCMGKQIVICNKAGEEIAVGHTSGADVPATSSSGIRYYLPDGVCRTSQGSYYYTDVYVQVTGSSSATDAGDVVTGDCN